MNNQTTINPQDLVGRNVEVIEPLTSRDVEDKSIPPTTFEIGTVGTITEFGEFDSFTYPCFRIEIGGEDLFVGDKGIWTKVQLTEKLTVGQKVDLLNSIQRFGSDFDDGTVLYVKAVVDDHLKSVFAQLGYDEQYIQVNEDVEEDGTVVIDIQHAAWNAGAKWFDEGDGFLLWSAEY